MIECNICGRKFHDTEKGRKRHFKSNHHQHVLYCLKIEEYEIKQRYDNLMNVIYKGKSSNTLR